MSGDTFAFFKLYHPIIVKGGYYLKLHENQLNLIKHIIQFNCLDYNSCLDFLDTENTGDRVALSYSFRPLTRNKYIAKNKANIVSILQKGRMLFPNEQPLIAEGGNEKGRHRVLQVSKIAALLKRNGITISGKLPYKKNPCFIPSACWRNIAPGILSTTRFVGMLIADGKKYAVYDIGDGSMEWQMRAESSLFYTKYGSYETKADGMIMICNNGMREKIAENIIRQTMWNRRSLLSGDYTERDKPVRYSRSPIKLRTQYEKVYLITPETLSKGLKRIYQADEVINAVIGNCQRLNDATLGDFIEGNLRFFVNSAYDLLKFVRFFSNVKEHMELEKKSTFGTIDAEYGIIMYKEDYPILKMYRDVIYYERVSIYELKSE